MLKTVVGVLIGIGLPCSFAEPRLGIEGVDLRRSAVHEQEDHRLGFRCVMRLRQLSAWRLSSAADSQREPAEAVRAPAQHFPARSLSGLNSMRVVDIVYLNVNELG